MAFYIDMMAGVGQITADHEHCRIFVDDIGLLLFPQCVERPIMITSRSLHTPGKVRNAEIP